MKTEVEGPVEVAEVIVTIADDHLPDLDAVVHRLRQSGLQVSAVLKSIGQVIGTASVERLEEVARVAGVLAVESSGTVQLPPPDSEIQ